MDEEMVGRRNLQWARLLVKRKGRNVLENLHIIVGYYCFLVRLWWEIPPPCNGRMKQREKMMGKARAQGSVTSDGVVQWQKKGEVLGYGEKRREILAA